MLGILHLYTVVIIRAKMYAILNQCKYNFMFRNMKRKKEKNHGSVRNCLISDNPYQKMAQLEISPYSQDFETTQLHHNPM